MNKPTLNRDQLRQYLKPPEKGDISIDSCIYNCKFTIEKNLIEEWHQNGHLSLVVMRHPFSRLASAYYNKMVELSTNRHYSKVGGSNDSLKD